jgi:hypothetical protein
MRSPNLTWFKELLSPQLAPCVSIYLPMLRADPPAQENARLFRELIDKAGNEMARGYPQGMVQPIVERLMSLSETTDFWVGPRDGVAIFAAPDYLRVIDLQVRPDARVDVADTFYIRPLIRLLQGDRSYMVLALTLKHVDLYAGNQYGLQRLDASSVPQDPAAVSKMRMSHQIDAAADVATATSEFPQEGTIGAVVSEDRFLRAVDKAVWEQFSRDRKVPLILVADEKRNAAFRSVSKNTYLMEKGSMLDPNGVDPARLHKETWALMEPQFEAEAANLVDQYQAARARQRGSDELGPVVEAASMGRIDTLLIDADRQIPGRIELDTDGATLRFRPIPADDPRSGDALDDLAEMVLKTDGAVLVLPPDRMPSDTGVAAIYRY